MAKVSVESSSILSNLSYEINSIKWDMSDNLTVLNNAFETACESWKDINSQTCDKALGDHNVAMSLAIGRLEDFENALNRLSKLAAAYEEI